MEFKLTVGFNPETLQRIDSFLKALNTNAPSYPVPNTEEQIGKTKISKRIIDAGQENSAGDGENVMDTLKNIKTNGKAQVITLEDLRKLTKEKSDKSKETKVKVVALIKEFAGSVSDIPEDKYTEYHNKLIQL